MQIKVEIKEKVLPEVQLCEGYKGRIDGIDRECLLIATTFCNGRYLCSNCEMEEKEDIDFFLRIAR